MSEGTEHWQDWVIGVLEYGLVAGPFPTEFSFPSPTAIGCEAYDKRFDVQEIATRSLQPTVASTGKKEEKHLEVEHPAP